MELSKAADTLKELGHPTRLSVYRELVKAGHEGLPVGELQKRLDIPASTLSHHLSSLISVSLKWFTEFGHLNRGDMLTSEQHRCHNEKKKFQRRV
ncbi:ArsR/SmtB family transcription factor [Enterobacter hormaechei]|uniref:ArsR/SmtB family transcription factor n=1 Tax=Enterobacter hormaechei TaxID=158836 RepID=UPI000791D4B8|nr:helix-turn-helix domain-containing protein [Enterobacter hormaechei]MCC9371116.1 helix-turn-helix domain-containing protein [Enterobacter hormaechei subsp. oharae]MCC9411361.1 helix-turn-helix domain-containing protein [Enterobacter hormaechei subsp. oharae]SAC53504.1 ArsR family transcriptional regulator [Enterobacter hormaechei]SAI54696.1 ArsR family transcriptional regulator [Enterobacter hormaechei]